MCHLLRTVFLLLRESRKGASSRKRALGYFAFLEGCNKFQLALFVPMVAASVSSNAVFSYSSPARMVEQSCFTLTFLSGVGLGPAAFTLNPERDCPSPEHLSNFCSTGASHAGTQDLLCCSAGIKVAADPALEKGSEEAAWDPKSALKKQPGTQSSSLGGFLCKVAQGPSL